MLSRMRDTYRWAAAITLRNGRRYEESRKKLLLIEGARRSASEYFALLATINLVLGDFVDVKNLLEIAVSRSAPTRPEYREYVTHYCEYYLNVLRGNEGARVRSLEMALRVSAPPIIRQWLPLS